MSEEFHRIRHLNKVFNHDEWADYCHECREDDSKRIRTTFGKYTFNDCDICLNPDEQSIVAKNGGFGYNMTLKWAECGNGLWSFGIDYNLGTAGGGHGVSWADLQGNEKSWRNGYPSELECKIAGWRKALKYIGNHEHNARTSPAEKLREMIEDEIKRLTRPQIVQLELF